MGAWDARCQHLHRRRTRGDGDRQLCRCLSQLEQPPCGLWPRVLLRHPDRSNSPVKPIIVEKRQPCYKNLVPVREATLADLESCGRICFEGFKSVNEKHGFPSNYATVEAARDRVRSFLEHPGVWGIVYEDHREILGFLFMSERDPVRGIGPIVVAPERASGGVGRQLMEAALERAAGSPSVRLTQESFNMQSMGLYASLGFDVTEPLAVLSGTYTGDADPRFDVRIMGDSDLNACASLYERVHGIPRTNEIRDAIRSGTAWGAIESGRLVAYASAPNRWPINHGVADTEAHMRALLQGLRSLDSEPFSLLLPLRQGDLLRWCLRHGFRAIKPVTLMSKGEYEAPVGSWYPSILY